MLPTANTESARSPAATILIVDDLPDARWALSNLIHRAGLTPVAAANGAEALTYIQHETPDLVLLDICLPDVDGFGVLSWARAQAKVMPVIMLTAYGKTPDAVRAMRAGAYDYVAKPFNHEEILLTISRALHERALIRPRRLLHDRPCQTGGLIDLMGSSAAVQRVQREVAQVAQTDLSVLVTGETGTGKELVARALHGQSRRAAIPLVVVDCGALPDSLIESELFGYEKGAFTGAHHTKTGAFEAADGGTIFLDELGNLPLLVQGKLLRALEARRIHRIGRLNEQDVDFRVLAATNTDLRAAVDQQTMRRDLYHRLAQFTIHLPPLRERKEDLPFLVDRFVAEGNRELGRQVLGLRDAAWEAIQRYDWPGNFRELRNLLRRAVLLCDAPDQMIDAASLGLPDAHAESLQPLPLSLAERQLSPDDHQPLRKLVGDVAARAERAILLRALELTEGNKARCARLLQVDYKTLRSKLKTYEIFPTRLGARPAGLMGAER
jgi:DNA-binding NtrC family response regulator